VAALTDGRDHDFAAAEADWTRYSQLASDKFIGQTALADFYQRRVEPAKELTALQAAAALPSPPSERFEPAPEQRSWKTFQRIVTLIDDQLMSFGWKFLLPLAMANIIVTSFVLAMRG